MFTIWCIIHVLGANINHVEADGWNALHFAVLNNRKDIVDLLLLNDINTETVTSVSQRIIYYYYSYHHWYYYYFLYFMSCIFYSINGSSRHCYLSIFVIGLILIRYYCHCYSSFNHYYFLLILILCVFHIDYSFQQNCFLIFHFYLFINLFFLP